MGKLTSILKITLAQLLNLLFWTYRIFLEELQAATHAHIFMWSILHDVEHSRSFIHDHAIGSHTHILQLCYINLLKGIKKYNNEKVSIHIAGVRFTSRPTGIDNSWNESRNCPASNQKSIGIHTGTWTRQSNLRYIICNAAVLAQHWSARGIFDETHREKEGIKKNSRQLCRLFFTL